VGMSLVELDAENFTVRFARAGVMLDLGAIGKGYAVERVVGWLREAGVTSALLHGGTSTIYGLGHPPDAECWKIALDNPLLTGADGRAAQVATVSLRDEALSVSAVWGRSFEKDGKTFGHVLDPRTGQPVEGALLAAVALPSATETDAFSTALLVVGEPGHERLAALRPEMRTLVMSDDSASVRRQLSARGQRDFAHLSFGRRRLSCVRV
jgi:thiamine biosynthesis lipoprotein